MYCLDNKLNDQLGEKGATLVEYALLVLMIVMICYAALQFLGRSASSQFSSIGSTLQDG